MGFNFLRPSSLSYLSSSPHPKRLRFGYSFVSFVRYLPEAPSPIPPSLRSQSAMLLALLALAQPPSEYLYVDLGAGFGCNTSAEEALACTQLVG